MRIQRRTRALSLFTVPSVTSGCMSEGCPERSACAACGVNRPAAQYSGSQRKKPAGLRRCQSCVTASLLPAEEVVRTVDEVKKKDDSADAPKQCAHCDSQASPGEKLVRCAACIVPASPLGFPQGRVPSVPKAERPRAEEGIVGWPGPERKPAAASSTGEGPIHGPCG